MTPEEMLDTTTLRVTPLPTYLTLLRLRDTEEAGEVLATVCLDGLSPASVKIMLKSFFDFVQQYARELGAGETLAVYARQDAPDDLALDDARPDSNTLAIDGEEPLFTFHTSNR